MAMAGAKVVVTGRTEAGGKETEHLIREASGDALFVRQDVTVEENWQRVIRTTIDTYGRLDFLVNNAGKAIVKPVADLTRDDLIFLRLVNLDGPFLWMKFVWPHMVAAGGGVILNMSAIKGGQLGLTRAGALEGAPVNIRVVSVHPGMIWTAGVPDMLGPKAEERKPSIAARIPWGETGEPQHVGDAVVYLCTDAAKFITGCEFNIDDGASAG